MSIKVNLHYSSRLYKKRVRSNEFETQQQNVIKHPYCMRTSTILRFEIRPFPSTHKGFNSLLPLFELGHFTSEPL